VRDGDELHFGMLAGEVSELAEGLLGDFEGDVSMIIPACRCRISWGLYKDSRNDVGG
jgi:hypothetical protein